MQGKETMDGTMTADATGESPSRLRSAIERGSEEIKRGAQHLKERAGQVVDSARQHVSDVTHRVTEGKLSEMVDDVGSIIQRHPGKAVLGALLVGTVLGSLLSRRRD